MKTNATTLFAALGILAVAATSWADHHEELKPYTGSDALEKMKTLAGNWTGTMNMGDEKVPITMEYKITSGGSALVETVFGGTPKEMVTVYHDDDEGNLTMTHYCMLHNRPALDLVDMEGNTLSFDLSDSCSLKDSKDAHMRTLVLTINDDGSIAHRWTMWNDGKETMVNDTVFTRENS
ncbi:MAG: hypothetical protein AAF591_12445 [Verrucomicrobiota bacterium]